MKTAIVILNWNGSRMLRQFLPTIIYYTKKEGVEIYVADNASVDDSLAVLVSDFPEVKRIILDKNYGFAEGYNRALKEIKATYYVLLNSDVEVTPFWLEPLVEYMDLNPWVAACQPKILSHRYKAIFEYAGACGGFIDRYGYPFCRGRVMGDVELDKGQYDEICSVFWVSGAAFMVRAADYWAAGGFDNRFFAHMEEIDLCWRLVNRERGLVCIPESVVYHVGAATLKKENPHKTFLNFRNNLIMLYKNLPEMELSAVMRTRCILDYLAAFFFLLKGQWKNAHSVARARKEFKKLRKELDNEREKNIPRKVPIEIPEMLNKSMLMEYYLKGKKRYFQLMK